MFLLFLFMALRFWSDNKIQAYDREWGKHMSDFINNRDDALPPVGKYNVGQKQVFWVQVACMFLLIVIRRDPVRRPYFAGLFPIPLIRIAAVVHAAAGFVLIIAVHRPRLRGLLGQGHTPRDDCAAPCRTPGRATTIRSGTGASPAIRSSRSCSKIKRRVTPPFSFARAGAVPPFFLASSRFSSR